MHPLLIYKTGMNLLGRGNFVGGQGRGAIPNITMMVKSTIKDVLYNYIEGAKFHAWLITLGAQGPWDRLHLMHHLC